MPCPPSTSLATLLFSPARGAVLSLLLGRPDERFFVREVARLTGTSVGAASRELATLASAGVLTREERGREVWYGADRMCPVFDELRSLVLKTAGAVGVLRAALAPLAARIDVAYLYGSLAKGTGLRASSDVDVMVLAERLPLSELARTLRPAEDRLRREINPSLYRPAEYARRLAEDHHFVADVHGSPKVFLIGTRDDLERLAQPTRPRASAAGDA